MSCSNGGNNGGSNLQTNPSTSFLDSIAEPSSPASAGDWSGSQEYVNSTGLAQLKAAEGYARRAGGLPGGQGVRIAIIDSGIDLTHPDLGNLAETSWTAGGEALSSDDHATFVAGIAGARRTQSSDPNDMHGMAYRATLVNFQASRPSQTESNGFVSFDTDDLVDAIQAASGLSAGSSVVESDIFNLSLGAFSSSDDTFASLRNAMRAAAAENKIMVIAAGNGGLSNPIYPAAYADDADIAGLVIVVGNLVSSNQAATSSNRCGDTRNYCLFAPGSSVRSTLDGGSYGVGSGTSFAAPYVAGAAAVVKAAFPGVSSRDVVDRLLLTAADLGDAGVDSTFGRGRLDLEAAMAPVGPTSLPLGETVDGPKRPVDESVLRLGRGFAMSAAAKDLLERAMAVDGMGFPYPVDLAKRVSTTKREHALSSFVGNRGQTVTAAGPAQARLAAFVADEERTRAADGPASTSLRDGAGGRQPLPLSFDAEVMAGTTVFASLNGGSAPRLGLAAGLAERQATFLQTLDILAPYHDLAKTPSGGGFSFSPVDGTTIAISALGPASEREGRQSAMQQVEILHLLPGGTEARLGIGLVQEEGGFAGGRTSGVFGDGASARSQFLMISLLGQLADDVDWFTTYSRGRSSIGAADGAVISRWSDTRSDAFGAGLVIRDLATEEDSLTLMLGQPLRQERAEATIELPVARRPDGTVVTAREQHDFAPKVREVAAEVGYRLPLGRNRDHDIRAAGFLRIHPDHDQARKPEAGIGLGYSWRF